MSGNSFIDLSNLSKPVTRFIEKVSDAIGVVYEPTRIKRKAKATILAKKIKTLGELEIKNEVEARTIARILKSETKNQENIERITKEATKFISDEAEPEKMSDDWITHFFNKAKFVSDRDMSVLWSKILAGEANCPGTYSKKTIEIVSVLDLELANLFTKMSSLCLKDNVGAVRPFIVSPGDSFYTSRGLSFIVFQTLAEIGLVNLSYSLEYSFSAAPPRESFSYFGKSVTFELSKGTKQLFHGHVVLTRAGHELNQICGANPDEEFLPFLKDKHKKRSIKLVY